ncbi:MAG: sel1 repeat family protein [Tannerella sp.]|nr:sel1 repeat family protein [Tannerella sp.]
MMEKGTNYSFIVRAIEDLTFQKVKAVSEQFMRDLPHELRQILLGELKCGPKLMETEPSMAAYLYTYGDIYEARLQRAFTRLSPTFSSHETEWFDYDGGQSIGAMVYHDFLKNRNLHQQIKRITLVHASESCLKRGALHAHLFFPQAELRLVCKSVNLLQAEDISTDAQWAKLHLLMNIRNLDSVSATHLSELIHANLQGYNQFVCLSPFYGDSSETTARLDAFVDTLVDSTGMFFAENLKANQLVDEKPWTCALRVFSGGGAEEISPAPDALHEIHDVEDEAETGVITDQAPETAETCELMDSEEEKTAESCELPETPETCEVEGSTEETPENHETAETCEITDSATVPGEVADVETLAERNEITEESDVVKAPEPEESDPVQQLRVLAERGNARAQNNLGFLYEIGQDVPQDDLEAVKWYQKAAEQEHAKAQYNLANHYAQGRGIEQDYEEAGQWYRKAANRGIPNAMNHLAAMYAAGRGVEQNEKESVKWYRKAAEQGDEFALRVLQKKGIQLADE